ncbi:MAG: nuclear transport factor 2 family protein [Methylocystis sp.]
MTQEYTMSSANLLLAHTEYYQAFAARNLQAMMDLWSLENISCVHPGWPVLVGRKAVIASYRDIFLNPQQPHIEVRQEQLLESDFEGRVFCIEEVGGALLMATNWFALQDSRWRLIHHQASPLALDSARLAHSGPATSFH